ncbi:MAG: pyridoxamine 5'-phosphate oxidase [Pseudomonadota bacterium]
MTNISTSVKRSNYKLDTLTMDELNSNPIKQFESWLDEALKTDMPEPTAMNLATSTSDGRISSRMVLLKNIDERGFVFFTNYESKKAHDIAANSHVALCFWWGSLERQVRIEGVIEKVSIEESNEYFSSRPRGSQVGAIASRQSMIIEDYQTLCDQVESVEKQFAENSKIPRPDYWGGYRVVPDSIEFWQGRPSRLHDRLRYKRLADVDWGIERLSP